MKAVTLKVVFDRKRVADNTKNRGLVQIEVIYDRKQMFISTGIKILLHSATHCQTRQNH